MAFYHIYTDGACGQNGSWNGGWAYVIIKDDELLYEDSDNSTNTTNNQMELTAVLQACYDANSFIKKDDCVIVHSDSSYLINCYKQDWWKNWQKNGWINSKKEPVKNRNIWENIIPFFEDQRFTFEKVKGHTGKKDWNDYVDKLAVAAKERL